MIDTHAHLDLPEFAGDLEAVLHAARAGGVGGIVCVATTLASTQRCLDLAARHPSVLFPTAGVHPNGCGECSDGDMLRLRALGALPQVRAIGETGMDFHRSCSDPQRQEAFFRLHIELALELDKPLIIHGRRADDDILRVLDDYRPAPKGVRHCFDASAHAAAAYMERGLHIAFGGLITRAGYKRLKQAAQVVPDERLLVETDCPYLTPCAAPRTRNEPAYLVHVVRALAELRGAQTAHVADTAARNAVRLGLVPSGADQLANGECF